MTEIWDSSVREEPLGEFCRIHAFYDCPVCRGEEPVWVIPIVDSRSDEITGNVTVREDSSVTITGHPFPEPQTVIVHLPAPETQRPELPPPVFTEKPRVQVVPSLPRPTPKQVRAAMELLADPLDLGEPRHVEAAARGRAVYEKAMALSEAEHIPYEDAIRRVLEGE